MNALKFGMVHTCQIISSSQDQRLTFVSGSVEFPEGALITGSVSGASGTLKTLIVESGTWAAGTAEGYLVLSFVSGSFESGENITGPLGAAVASGTLDPEYNAVGTPQKTLRISDLKCLFSHVSGGVNLENHGSGDYIVSQPIVFLPGDAVVLEGDRVTSSTPGFNGPFEVTGVNYYYRLFSTTIDHIEASLKAVNKRG